MVKKISIMFFLVCMCFVYLFLRIGIIATNAEYKQISQNQSTYTLTLPTQRKNIYDENMKKLVNEQYRYIASVIPTNENIEIIKKHKVGLTIKDIEKLAKSQKPFLCEVDDKNINANGIDVFTIFDRYSKDQLLNHIVGYLDNNNNGLTGLEKGYDDFLKMEDDIKITYTIDALGRYIKDDTIKVEYEDISKDGIITTIDKDIQKICEDIGSKKLKKGSILVMDCENGDIKASCSFPNFNRLSLSQSVNDNEGKPMINRSFTNTSVGSTFKIVTLATAIYDGIQADKQYNCVGYYDLQGTHINCHNIYGHGVIDLKTALMKSCNPYFIDLGLNVNKNNFLRIANDLSFGKGYKLAENIYTNAGYLPSLEELENKGELANFSFGQGKLSATPVQLAQMISSVVNNGITPTPRLIKGVYENGTFKENKTTLGIKAMSEYTANIIKSYLISCVMDNEGQNAKPYLTTAGGKTATAQTGMYKNGEELCNGWFAGFFSHNEKNYAVVVLAEDATYGNEDASPVFREIVDKIVVLKS